jgi:hypothetical protein
LFQLLRNHAATGVKVNLPDPTPVLPYLDLFALVILNPTGVTGLRIPTLYLPGLFSLQNNQFRPTRTRAGSALIFDVIAAAGNTTVSHGLIPLSPEQPEFSAQRYWRLPINTEIILAALLGLNYPLSLQTQQQSRELGLARTIYGRLLVQGGGGRGNNGSEAAGTFKSHEKGEPIKKRPRMVAPDEDPGSGLFIEERAERARDQSREQF